MECYGKTDRGLKRKNNQDSFKLYTCKRYTAAVVCDGMGGAKGGSVASNLASSVFMKALRAEMAKRNETRMTSGDYEKVLTGALSYANTAVYEKAGTSEALEGMGTTLVAFITVMNRAYVLNTGDSRLYALKNGKLEQITKDHSFVQYLLDNGSITREQAENHPQKNIILKVVGVYEYAESDVFSVRDCEMLLLCTDGLTNLVSDDEIENVLADEMDCATKADILITLANQRGGTDNITAVVYQAT